MLIFGAQAVLSLSSDSLRTVLLANCCACVPEIACMKASFAFGPDYGGILTMLMPTGSREEIDKVVEYIATLPEGELALPVMGTLPQYSLQGYGRDGGLLLTPDLTKARQIQEPCRASLAAQLAERAHRVANCSVIVSADGIEGFTLKPDDLDQVIGVRTLFHISLPGGEVLLVYPTVADHCDAGGRRDHPRKRHGPLAALHARGRRGPANCAMPAAARQCGIRSRQQKAAVRRSGGR